MLQASCNAMAPSALTDAQIRAENIKNEANKLFAGVYRFGNPGISFLAKSTYRELCGSVFLLLASIFC
jgi:hypothetical protein